MWQLHQQQRTVVVEEVEAAAEAAGSVVCSSLFQWTTELRKSGDASAAAQQAEIRETSEAAC
jgi:hypothetical protein